jgi:hypothetical protein
MSRRPISPEQGPTSQQPTAFTDGELAPEQREPVPVWPADYPAAQAQADADAEANRCLLRLFSATRPEGPSPEAWGETLTWIKAALLAGCAPPGNARPVRALPALVTTASVASPRREPS